MPGFTQIPNDEVFDDPLWTADKFTKGQALIDLYKLAQFQNGIVHKRGIIIELMPGQLGWSMESLRERWKWSIGKVRRFLKYLEKAGQIEIQKTNVSSTITLKHWINNDMTNKHENGKQTVSQTARKRYPNNIVNKDNTVNIEKREKSKLSLPIEDLNELHKAFTGKANTTPNETEISIYRGALENKSINEWIPYCKERLKRQTSGSRVPAAKFFFDQDYTKFEQVQRKQNEKPTHTTFYCINCKSKKQVPANKTYGHLCDECGSMMVDKYELKFYRTP